MKKWIAIPVIAVLAIGVIITGYSLWQQTSKLTEANEQIVTLKASLVTPPNLTATQALGIVGSALLASTPQTQQMSCWFKTEFNYSNRQWMVTAWASEEDSKKYYGSVYIVDDATGKVLNPPPVYTPK